MPAQVTADDFEAYFDQFYRMNSTKLVAESYTTSIKSRINPAYNFTIPFNYVHIQNNAYKYNFFSNNFGAVNTDGVLLLVLQNETYKYNGVSFEDTFY